METIQTDQADQGEKETNSTYLVPFNFQAFRTGEAVWCLDKNELIKMFRVTGKGMGEFFGAKNPQNYFDILKHRYPYLPEGIPFTVKGMTGQNYVTKTFDTWDVYQYAIKSDLPRAEQFLQEFPNFLQAFHNHTIKPPAIGDIKPEVIAFSCVPHNKRGEYQKAVCAQYGWAMSKFYKLFNKAKATLGLKSIEFGAETMDALSQINIMPFGKKRQLVINELAEKLGRSPGNIRKLAKKITKEGNQPRKPRKDKGSCKNPLFFKTLADYLAQNPGTPTKALARIFLMDPSTVRRWRKKIDYV